MYVSLSYLTVSQRSTIIILDSLAIFILKNISNRNMRDLNNNKQLQTLAQGRRVPTDKIHQFEFEMN